jgi:hypothetical protein
VSAVCCDKNLEQWINSEFYVQIGNSASETSAILTLACGEYAMKKSSVSECQAVHGRARRCARGPKKWAAKIANVDRVRALVLSDRGLGVGLTAEEWNMKICSEEKTRTVA